MNRLLILIARVHVNLFTEEVWRGRVYLWGLWWRLQAARLNLAVTILLRLFRRP